MKTTSGVGVVTRNGGSEWESEAHSNLHSTAYSATDGSLDGVRISGLMAEVKISIGDQQITSIITASSAREMNIKLGQTAAALIKATKIMVLRVRQKPECAACLTGGYRGSSTSTGLSCYNSLKGDLFSGTFRGLATPESPASALVCPRCHLGDLRVDR